jgi:hypothetical protein
MRVLRDQSCDHGDGLVGPPQLVICARLLVEDLIVVFVGRIGGEDLVVQLDRLQRTRPRHLFTAGELEIEALVRRLNPVFAGRAPFEAQLGFRAVCDARGLEAAW